MRSGTRCRCRCQTPCARVLVRLGAGVLLAGFLVTAAVAESALLPWSLRSCSTECTISLIPQPQFMKTRTPAHLTCAGAPRMWPCEWPFLVLLLNQQSAKEESPAIVTWLLTSVGGGTLLDDQKDEAEGDAVADLHLSWGASDVTNFSDELRLRTRTTRGRGSPCPRWSRFRITCPKPCWRSIGLPRFFRR